MIFYVKFVQLSVTIMEKVLKENEKKREVIPPFSKRALCI
jgi:hypothetical protein